MCNKLRKFLKTKIRINNEAIDEKEPVQLLQRKKKTQIFHIEKDYRLQCPYANCGKKFKIRGNLNIHIRTHTGERSFKCPIVNCGKSFVTKGNLKSHISNHTGEKYYTCDYPGCNKRYSHLCRLNIHRRTHTGDKPFVCPNCSKSFNEKGNLVTHYRIHTGEKPYICNFEGCSRSFKAKSHLKDHQKIHLNYKPFQCETCSEKFSRFSTLRIHRLIHTGEKPHVCPHPLCFKRFADKGNMKNHFKLHFKDASKEVIRDNFIKMSRFLEDKKPSNNSVDTTDIFWKDSASNAHDIIDTLSPNVEVELNASQLNYRKKSINLAFCEFMDNVVNNDKFKDFDITPELNSLSGYVDMTGWNDIFNIGSVTSADEANLIPNYFNLFVENNN